MGIKLKWHEKARMLAWLVPVIPFYWLSALAEKARAAAERAREARWTHWLLKRCDAVEEAAWARTYALQRQHHQGQA